MTVAPPTPLLRWGALVGALALLSTPSGVSVVRASNPPVLKYCRAGDCNTAPMRGGDDAQVSIVEVGDFQCRFSRKAAATVQKIMETYGADVQHVFVHNPLPFHKEARLAAIASVAAQKQGRFWEMHDALFANRDNLERPDLEGYARGIRLSMDRFRADLNDRSIGQYVDHNRAIAKVVNARGTPCFFINGKILKGAQSFKKFAKIIDKEIAAARKKKARVD